MKTINTNHGVLPRRSGSLLSATPIVASACLLAAVSCVRADGADQVLAFWDFNTAAGGAPSTVPNIDNVPGTPAISFTSATPVTATGIAGTAWTSHDFSGNTAGLNTPPRHVVAAGNAHGWNDVWVASRPNGQRKGIITLSIDTTGFKDLSLRFDYRSAAAAPVTNHDLTAGGFQVLGNESLTADGTWREYYYDLRFVPGAENNPALTITLNDFDTGISEASVTQFLIDNVLVMGRPLADAESISKIVGVQGLTLSSAATYMLGQNLQSAVMAEGVVTSVAGGVIGDSRAVFNSSLAAGQTWLFEVTRGAQAGYHQAVQAGWGGQSLTLAASPAGAVAVGDRYAIRRVPTISSVFGSNNEVNLLGGTSAAAADILWVWDDSLADYRKYYYGTNAPVGWRRTTTDGAGGGDLISPYDAVFLEKRNSSARNYWFTGDVKLYPTQIPLLAGDNFVSRLLPVPARAGSLQLAGAVEAYSGTISTQDSLDNWASWFSDGSALFDLYSWNPAGDTGMDSGLWISQSTNSVWSFDPRNARIPGAASGPLVLTLPPQVSAAAGPLLAPGSFNPSAAAPTLVWQDKDRIRYWIQKSTDLRTWTTASGTSSVSGGAGIASPAGLVAGDGGASASFTASAAVAAGTSCFFRLDSPSVFLGGSDASAVQIVDQSNLALVADDEATNMDLYDLKVNGASVANSGDLSGGLLLPMGGEGDFEGMTRLSVGGQTWYICTTSHGRTKDGELKLYDASTGSILDPAVPGQQFPNRSRLFAMAVNFNSGVPSITLAGAVFRNFEFELGRWDRQNLHGRGVNYFGIANAIGMTTNGAGQLILDSVPIPALAPKVSGLSLEGLSADNTGTQLLFGLRNPLRNGRAIIMRVTNPLNVLGLNGAPLQPPAFDAGTDINLGGRGIRSIEWSPALGAYLIVAGTKDGVSNFAIYRWSGNPAENPLQIQNNGTRWASRKFRPEGLAVVPGSTEFFVVSDDGTQPLRDDLTNFSGVSKNATELARRFSGLWMSP